MRHCLRVFCGLYLGHPTDSTKAANSSHGGYCLTRPKSRTAWEELRICWCLLSVFLIYCSDEWKKLVNLIYCVQVLFRMNFKIMYFLMKILGNTPSADSAASRDSLSSQNATWGIVFFSSFYWWHIEYKGWMCERLLNLQEIYVSGQNICIEVYGNSVGTITPMGTWCRWPH